ncbi:MAG: AlpA family phage regulatory protein [Methylococcaceae bacterium]
MLDQTTNHSISNTTTSIPNRIIRANEVHTMTGLSRATLWRMENKQEFPRRVSLGANSVGWRLSELGKVVKRKIVSPSRVYT